jgi:hypothetical protein
MIALLFGDWQAVRPAFPKDVLAILYISLGTTCLPTLITVWLQRHISPLTVSFIYILEPVLGAFFSFLYLHESLPLDGYLGGALIVAGAVIQTWSTAHQPATNDQVLHAQFSQVQARTSWFASLIYPLLCCLLGGFVLLKLGGFPPRAWLDLLHSLPRVALAIQQGHGLLFSLLVGQSLSWLLAWAVLLALAILALVRTRHLLTPQPVRSISLDPRPVRQLAFPRNRVPARARRTESPHIQQRRVQRKRRLAGAVKHTASPAFHSFRPRNQALEVVDLGDTPEVSEQYELFDQVVW